MGSVAYTKKRKQKGQGEKTERRGKVGKLPKVVTYSHRKVYVLRVRRVGALQGWIWKRGELAPKNGFSHEKLIRKNSPSSNNPEIAPKRKKLGGRNAARHGKKTSV